MTTITKDIKYRLSLIRCAEKYGVAKAAIKYKTNRQYIIAENVALTSKKPKGLRSIFLYAVQHVTVYRHAGHFNPNTF